MRLTTSDSATHNSMTPVGLWHLPTVARRVPVGSVAFDAMGRRVLDPKSGVYFVRGESALSSQHSGAAALRRVVVVE